MNNIDILNKYTNKLNLDEIIILINSCNGNKIKTLIQIL